jgi:hypothetical protein
LPNPIAPNNNKFFDKPNSQRFFPIKAGAQGTYTVGHNHSLIGQMTPAERKYELPLESKIQRAALPASLILAVLLICGTVALRIRRRRGCGPE